MRFFLIPFLTFFGMIMTTIAWLALFELKNPLEKTGIGIETWIALFASLMLLCGTLLWLISREFAIASTGARTVKNGPGNERERLVSELLEKLARDIGLKFLPSLRIYPSPEINLFSSGPWPSRSVVVVSEGFLSLNEREKSVLLYAELAKIKKCDTALLVFCLSLTTGILLIPSWSVRFLGSKMRPRSSRLSSSSIPETILSTILTTFFTLAGSLIVALFARKRQESGDQAILDKFGKTGLDMALTLLERSSFDLEHYDLFTLSLKANYNSQFWEAPIPSHPTWAKRRGLLYH